MLFNINSLFESGLIDYLINEYSNPVIVLFGSYSKGEDIENSDIDIYIETPKMHRFDLQKFEKILKRKIQIFNHRNIKEVSNLHLSNNIINGITLNNFIEVFTKKESTWNECLSFNSAIKITPDKEKAKSLLEIAEERIACSIRELSDKNANYVFEDYYSSILELLHSIVLLYGYKVSNHICLGYYLRDVLKREALFRLFDDCRFKRNSLVYYGKRMDFETAKDAIEKSKRMIMELDKIIKLEKNLLDNNRQKQRKL